MLWRGEGRRQAKWHSGEWPFWLKLLPISSPTHPRLMDLGTLDGSFLVEGGVKLTGLDGRPGGQGWRCAVPVESGAREKSA